MTLKYLIIKKKKKKFYSIFAPKDVIIILSTVHSGVMVAVKTKAQRVKAKTL